MVNFFRKIQLVGFEFDRYHLPTKIKSKLGVTSISRRQIHVGPEYLV